MDGRTRVKNALDRKAIDRVPRYDSFWEDTLTRWKSEGYPNGIDPGDFFDWDIVTMSVDTSMRQGMKLIHEDEEYQTIQDRYGYTVRKAKGKSRSLEFSDHVTDSEDAWKRLRERFVFDPSDLSRIDEASYFLHFADYPTWPEAKTKYDRLREKGKYLLFASYGPWEGTWRHRGYSQLLMDIALSPDWVRDMAEAEMQLLLDTLAYAISARMKPDALFLVDDLASTKTLLFSPQSWRTIFKPLYQKLGRFLQDNEISFWLHCCGKVEILLEDFIECGLNVIQPLQAHAGMDVRVLKPKYGDRLAFWGNIDARAMSGPLDALETELRGKITVAKAGGGYLYHSDHSVPPEVSFERYQWIMARVREYGAY